MSWLKNLGKVGVVVGQVIPGVAPFATLAGSFIPGDKDDKAIAKTLTTVDHLAGIIAQVEVMGQALALPGAQKLTAATPLIAQAILQSSAVTGKEIANPELFKQGCEKIAGGLADCLNSLKA